ncbi:MAG: PIN domain-containing protein [Prevotella sp.]|nr:PIN domain-containing protein [Prevotella sp.]
MMLGTHIFIDTSVFQAEGFLKESSRVSKLFALAAKGYLTILLPEITKEEWRKHFSKATLLPVDEFKRKMMIMGSPDELSKAFEIISAIDSESTSTAVLDSCIAKAKIQIIGYDYCSDVEGVFKKYFNCEKPFGKKGKQKEFPDAFVLSALEQYAKKNHIENIILLSHDGDIIDYKSDILTQKEIGEYLNGILKEIAISEAEKRDIERLYVYFHKGEISFAADLKELLTDYLLDYSTYDSRVQWQEIEDVTIKEAVALSFSDKDMQLTEINNEYLEAICFVDVNAIVTVEHVDESMSYWDSEEKKYLFKEYTTSDLVISASIKLTIRMDRTELVMGQDPVVELCEIEYRDLQEAIDGETEY